VECVDYGRRLSRAARTADPGGLDVERLHRAMERAFPLRVDPAILSDIVTEYAALASETTAPARMMTMRVGPTAGGRRVPDPASFGPVEGVGLSALGWSSEESSVVDAAVAWVDAAPANSVAARRRLREAVAALKVAAAEPETTAPDPEP
jgi:hypothetical protein